MELTRKTIVIAAAALAALNISSLTISGLVVAALLGIAAFIFVRRTVVHEHAIYVFLVAELSPLGLQSHVWLAALYQAFALLLFAALLSSFESVRPLGEYRSSLVKILVAASAFLGVNGVVFYVTPFGASGPQLLGLTTGSALAILAAVLLIENYKARLPKFTLLGNKV